MIRRNKTSVVSIFADFRQMIQNKPPVNKMIEDLQLMKFKIRPLTGDIDLLKKSNDYLIEMLWSLGKLDEMFSRESRHLTAVNRSLFMSMFETLREQYQEELNKVTLSTDRLGKPGLLEMEIFREIGREHKTN